MIRTILVVSLLYTVSAFGQNHKYYMEDGFIAEGYDVVAYFSGEAIEGDSRYTASYDGATYQFKDKANLAAFKNNPDKYVPAFGGWCAYAVGANNEKVRIDPETFTIQDGRLLLFYNFYFTNTLESWKEENPKALLSKADQNWKTLEHKAP